MKRKKFTKTVSGKTRARSGAKKTAKRGCKSCGTMLHGMPHGLSMTKARSLSKSQKRPSVMFAGELCSKCRRKVLDEAIMVTQNSKSRNSIDLSMRKAVEKAMEKLE